jgi:hypothetical protein
MSVMQLLSSQRLVRQLDAAGEVERRECGKVAHTGTFLRTPAHPGALPSPLLSSPRLLPCLVFNLSLN